MSEAHPLHRILSRVEKPGRYTGGEWNEIKKDPRSVETRVALVYPDVYEIGMSHLGQKILYSVLNADGSVSAERVFAPWPDFEQALREAGQPLVSLENSVPLAEFDIIGFSLLYELNYSNILTILDLGGLPLFSGDRDDRHPLVIAGGPAAFNPEPTAAIFDLFFIGDGEAGFLEIIRAYRDLRKRSPDRVGILRELSWIPGVYVPALYRPVRTPASPLLVPEPIRGAPARIEKRILEDFGRSHFPTDIVVPNLRVVFDRVAVEAARGCPLNCRFCQASSLYFPHRPKDPDFLVETAVESLRRTGYGDCSLSALSVSDHPCLEETVRVLMDALTPHKISLSLSSLRPGGLSREIVQSILRVRKTGFTLVPEAGTQRLRNVINKKLDDSEIDEALHNAFSAGWRLVKFYFMIGLPTETEEDLDGIVSLVRRSHAMGRSVLKAPPRIHVSLSSFIPKPHTPFQWVAMEDAPSLERKRRRLRAELKRLRSVDIKDHPVQASVLEAVFSRGDRRLSEVLRRAWRDGARFDSWGDHFDFSKWEGAFAAEGVSPTDYLGALDPDAPLPWGRIDVGIKTSLLLEELASALRGEASPSCLEKPCAVCRGCEIRSWKNKPKPKAPSVPPGLPSGLGVPGGDVLRYRAFYSKTGKARYLSHIDLIHVLQRAFRRAGIEVRLTRGFHPKPDFTYGPALALGMEGRREALEFRSVRAIEAKAFLDRINASLPEGIRFLGLTKLSPSEPSLAAATERLVYSLKNPAGLSSSEISHRLGDYRRRHGDQPFEFRLEGHRLILEIPLSPPKPPRPQDIVSEAFGVENPAFLLTRDGLTGV